MILWTNSFHWEEKLALLVNLKAVDDMKRYHMRLHCQPLHRKWNLDKTLFFPSPPSSRFLVALLRHRWEVAWHEISLGKSCSFLPVFNEIFRSVNGTECKLPSQSLDHSTPSANVYLYMHQESHTCKSQGEQLSCKRFYKPADEVWPAVYVIDPNWVSLFTQVQVRNLMVEDIYKIFFQLC